MQLDDKIISKLIEIDDKVDRCATKEDLKASEERVITVLDGHTATLERLDLERMAMITRFERVEDDIVALKNTPKR
ncbi:hypothetical protein HY633_04475 [Candidatus Uhrbacteria bacterium]|nr:hypothetical protein [Candidatus Uhrbacteria bacterium]